MPTDTVARPKFSRQHYQAVADALGGVCSGFDDGGACRFGVEVAAEALAALFAEDNPRFKRGSLQRLDSSPDD